MTIAWEVRTSLMEKERQWDMRGVAMRRMSRMRVMMIGRMRFVERKGRENSMWKGILRWIKKMRKNRR